jgi:protein gp37
VSGHPFEQGFALRLVPEALNLPLKWTKSRLVFVNSMSDLFHEAIPDEYITRVFDVVRRAVHHQFQILTKRAERMAAYCKGKDIPSNAWLGVSVENARYKTRIAHLQTVPARIRFLSIEPLIGSVGQLDLRGMNWVIVGGESGPRCRPMRAEWVREVREQCFLHGVPFFFKQWGGTRKGRNGRVLDGRTWDDFPRTYAMPSPQAHEIQRNVSVAG